MAYPLLPPAPPPVVLPDSPLPEVLPTLSLSSSEPRDRTLPEITQPEFSPRLADTRLADSRLADLEPLPAPVTLTAASTPAAVQPPDPAVSAPVSAPTPQPAIVPLPPTSTPAVADPATVPVQSILITGSTILDEPDRNRLTQPLLGRVVALAELQQLADQITQIYLDRGYITSRALLDQTQIRDGVVPIQVVEGSLEQIEVEGTRRLNPAYVRRRVALGTGTPLNASQLEDQLRLLRADPLFSSVEASLRAGTQFGKSILRVRVQEANPIGGGVSVDNYSPPSVGAERVGATLGYRNLTGIGDQVDAFYSRTFSGGDQSFGLAYQAPLNPLNGTVQLRANWDDNKITDDEFEALNIRGSTELYELIYRQPLVRSPRAEFALSLGFTYENGQTFLFNDSPFPFGIGPDADGVSRTSVIRFGQDYVKRDASGAWALRSQFNFGTGLFNATENSGEIPDGQFFSWLGQIQRVQQLGNRNLLIVQADVQLTPDALLPSQQFVVGGGQSVRGYRQNARSGDNGVRLSIEDRFTLVRDATGSPTLQLTPFFELGAVWNMSSNPNRQPSQTVLPSLGLGLLWQPLAQLSVRLNYGLALVDLADRGDNPQDNGFTFSLNYQL